MRECTYELSSSSAIEYPDESESTLYVSALTSLSSHRTPAATRISIIASAGLYPTGRRSGAADVTTSSTVCRIGKDSGDVATTSLAASKSGEAFGEKRSAHLPG